MNGKKVVKKTVKCSAKYAKVAVKGAWKVAKHFHVIILL